MKAWVALWDRHEPPHVLAAIRILIGLILVIDLVPVYTLDLVETLYAPLGEGGLARIQARDTKPLLYQWMSMDASTAWWSWGLAIGSAAAFGLGLLTPASGIVFVLASANLSDIMPLSDRAIDTLLRNAVLILSLSSSHRVWSIDALLRWGGWRGDSRPSPAWPRFLLIAQLFIMYGTAGMQKVGLAWTPVGDWSALYIVLRDPAFALVGVETLDRYFWLTQIATLMTWLWEWSTPLAGYALCCRTTRTRSGRLRAWLNAHGFWYKWVFVGVVFHVGIALTMRLGLFPWGTLALYPAFFPAQEWRCWLGRLPVRLAPTNSTPKRNPSAGGAAGTTVR